MFRLFGLLILIVLAAVIGLVQPEAVQARCNVKDIIYYVESEKSRNEIRERCDDEIDVEDCSLSHVIRMVQRMLRARTPRDQIVREINETCGGR